MTMAKLKLKLAKDAGSSFSPSTWDVSGFYKP